MHRKELRAAIAPAGLVIEKIELVDGELLITGHSRAEFSCCPDCRQPSRRIHSRYRRRLGDLPSHGRLVRIELSARRFRCGEPSCARQIFVERFAEDVAPTYARRTGRFESVVHHLGLALGGRPAAGLARRLLMPVSRDTLLRTVRRHAVRVSSTPTIIGIDDWAWKRGQRYGTVICDLEHRQIIDILPDREAASVEAWPKAHPDIKIISRDRGGGYGHAAARALPGARQVADRWHLMENASQAFFDAVRKSMRAIREAMGAGEIDPALLTCAERLQYEGFLRRQEADAAIRALADKGMPIKAIVRATGYNRKTVRQVVRGGRNDIFRSREATLTPWLAALDAEWDAGCRNGAELWRRLQVRGFRGSSRVVAEWTTRRRRNDAASGSIPSKCPSARVITRLMTMARDLLSRADALLVAKIEAMVPALSVVRDLVDRFHKMIQHRRSEELPAWLEQARPTTLASFVNGLNADHEAVAAAIVEPCSNGQAEGQITKLKLMKRQMYGRAKLDLLKARLIHPSTPTLHQM